MISVFADSFCGFGSFFGAVCHKEEPWLEGREDRNGFKSFFPGRRDLFAFPAAEGKVSLFPSANNMD